jgi:hypothetical protein
MVHRSNCASRNCNTAVKRRAQACLKVPRHMASGLQPSAHDPLGGDRHASIKTGPPFARNAPHRPQRADPAQRRARRPGALPPHYRDRRRPLGACRPLRHRSAHPARAGGVADASARARRTRRTPEHRAVGTAMAHLAARARPPQPRPGQAPRRRSALCGSGVDRLGDLGPAEGVVSRLHPPHAGHAVRHPGHVGQGPRARRVLVAQLAERGGADQLPVHQSGGDAQGMETRGESLCAASATCSTTCRRATCA